MCCIRKIMLADCCILQYEHLVKCGLSMKVELPTCSLLHSQRLECGYSPTDPRGKMYKFCKCCLTPSCFVCARNILNSAFPMQIHNAHLLASWVSAFQNVIQFDHKWPNKQSCCGKIYDATSITTTPLRLNLESFIHPPATTCQSGLLQAARWQQSQYLKDEDRSKSTQLNYQRTLVLSNTSFDVQWNTFVLPFQRNKFLPTQTDTTVNCVCIGTMQMVKCPASCTLNYVLMSEEWSLWNSAVIIRIKKWHSYSKYI